MLTNYFEMFHPVERVKLKLIKIGNYSQTQQFYYYFIIIFCNNKIVVFDCNFLF
jgi:hypothetical protein